MIYRTSQRSTYRNINNNLDLLSYRIAQLSNKMASEKSINKPSDNPSGASAVLRTRTVLSEISQYTDNVNYANNWLTNTGNVMDSIKGTLDEIYSKAEQGATDTYTADQRKIIATEIDELFQTLIQFGDSKFGGNYLFGGTDVGSQPFSLNMRAQEIIAACENSSLWTGKVQNYGDPTYATRPDLPPQSQKYLVEVVQPGGIDSRLYAGQSSNAVLTLTGQNVTGSYSLAITAQSPAFNQTKVRLVPGEANVDRTGTGNSEIVYKQQPATYSSAINVIYTYGTSGATTAAFNSATNTVTVYLETTGAAPFKAANSVTSEVVANAVNSLGLGFLSASAVATGTPPSYGQVDLAKGPQGQALNTSISFNHQTHVEVDGSNITVYLRRDTEKNGGNVIATINEDVVTAINSDPEARNMIWAQSVGNGSGGLAPTVTEYRELLTTTPYTLAFAEVALPGSHNDLRFSILNPPPDNNKIGAAGNDIKIQYVYDFPPVNSPLTTAAFSASTSTLTVSLAISAAVYTEEYARQYTNPNLPGFQNSLIAHQLAAASGCTATGLDVISAVNVLNTDPNNYLGIGATLVDGNSGLGKMSPTLGPVSLSQGYSQPALFRVSQDGGKTWGPPQSFAPSEYPNGDLFYNSQLGHASLTTGIPGRANDLVFTANYLGTWGDDVRIEYKQDKNQPLSVTVGPKPFNICVNLATNSAGTITSTANDVMKAINQHAEASQLVTVGLANYHEGGSGLVTALACQSLSTGEPYEVGGQTKITPLGHATGTVAFSYAPGIQASPDLIYQALNHGSEGNNIGIRYTTSADPAVYGLVPGEPDVNFTGNLYSAGTGIINNRINYQTSAGGPVTVSYKAFENPGSATTAVWNSATNTVTVFLEINSGTTPPAISAGVTSEVVANAVNSIPGNPKILASALGTDTGGGIYAYGPVELNWNPSGTGYFEDTSITFNNSPFVTPQYQDSVSISYETNANGSQVVVVHLATTSIPSCPDQNNEPDAYKKWRELYPVYSCTSSRAVVTTAGDILQALVSKNLENPGSALVWASMDFKDEGWDSTAKVGPTEGTVWLSGGNDALKEEDYGIALKFIPDGTALQVGDLFQVDVGWYNGNQENLDVNVMNNYRTTMNTTGDQLMGQNGAPDNILDAVQRLYWGLNHNDSEMVAAELPKLKAAIEKVTTMETNVGTKIIRNQFVINNLDQNKYAAESTLSQIEDADFTRLITDLKNAQLIYEAVLGTTGLTTKLSLLNYI